MNIIKQMDSIITRIFHADYVKHARTLFLLFVVILFLPILLTQFPIGIIDFSETGQIGDTIGGITAPFIGAIAGYLTFLAFHEQYRANDEAKKDLTKERFESKFYNFLSLLNNLEINTDIPHVGNYKQAFHFMFYEYKAIIVLLNKKIEIEKKEIITDVRKEAFGIFINGVSSSSTSRMKEYLEWSDITNDYFLNLQDKYSKVNSPKVPYLADYETTNIKLFDGHRLRLISFFRLICKIIEMIYNDGGDYKELYLSTLLSVLSEHQIALLKLIYIYDRDEHERFIMSNKDLIDHFFMDQYNVEKAPEKVCISKYIFTDIMDCTKEKFVDLNKNFVLPL